MLYRVKLSANLYICCVKIVIFSKLMANTTLPKLNFPPIKLRAREIGGSISIWDTIRRAYILLTPEEWVRQHLIAFLTSQLAIPPTTLSLEYPVSINGQNQRADLVVMHRDGTPLILAECKAPEVAISQSTLDQAVRYNSKVEARYLILTNGLSHFIYERDSQQGHYTPLKEFTQISLDYRPQAASAR